MPATATDGTPSDKVLAPGSHAVLSGPADPAEALNLPPAVGLPRPVQLLRFSYRQIEFVFRARRELGDVFQMSAGIKGGAIVTSHPDDVRALFTANPEDVPTLTGESPLRPVVGPNSVLTANGARHLRQRKLLLPPFHGEAIDRYADTIRDATDREIHRWPIGKPFSLAPRMQAVTLEVIMSGIFGIHGELSPDSSEHRLRRTIKGVTAASTTVFAQATELMNFGGPEPNGFLRRAVLLLDRAIYPIVAERRQAEDLQERQDVLSILLAATTEEGEHLSDEELRDELITLVLAGFETTANSLAWAWERLTRTPDAHERLREAVRCDERASEIVEETITETMRCRPVIPIVGRRVSVPWRLGEYVVPAASAISVSILLLHHRDDLYEDPFAFRPERWTGRKPGTYEWIPFGGGTRRCLGAQLAMAEQRIVLAAMARVLDLQADQPDPEHAQHRNVTMIPARGTRVIVRRRSG